MRFAFALHETGHAALLPPHVWTHSSLLPVSSCPACISEGEKDDLAGKSTESSGHTFYKAPGPEGLQNILYSIAGGAAEVACGSVQPQMMSFDGLGEYPIGMGGVDGDFDVLSGDFKAYELGPLENYADDIRRCFNLAVEHLRPHAERMRGIAKLLADRGVLRNGDVDFGFVEYVKLVESVSAENDATPEQGDDVIPPTSC